MSRADAVLLGGVFVLALVYLLMLRRYGFQLEDEGTLLSAFDRVWRGQRPYLDFHTGYTPGFFAFGTAVYAIFGSSVTALRGVLAVLNALTAALLTRVTQQVAGRWLAPLPALLWLAFVPVYVGEFAAFNVPYPAWPVTLAWVVLALALLAWMERPRAHLLVLSGVVAAWAMWFRPNSGAFALAAATWVVVTASARPAVLDRIAAFVAAAFMAIGVWFTFEFRVTGIDAFVHLVPTVAIAALAAGPLAARLASPRGPRAIRALATLAIAFVVPTLAWMLPLLASLGRARFLTEVLFVGADYQSLYYKPHPAPEPYAVLVVAGGLAGAFGGWVVARRRVRPLPLLAAVGVVVIVAKLALVRSSIAPEGLVRAVLAQLENAGYWLAVAASFGSVAWLWRVPSAVLQHSRRARALLVLAPLAVAMYLQMFPRSDFMHHVISVPLTAAVACGLLARVAAWWGRGRWPHGWDGPRVVRRSVQAVAAAILLLAFGEKVRGPIQAWSNAAPRTPMPARLDVHVEDAAGDELAAIAATVDYLRAHTTEGEQLWSFPAANGLLFAADRATVGPRDYWYPGRPDHREERHVLDLLRAKRPRFIVTLGKGWTFFAEAPLYFAHLRRFVAAEYRLVARYGRYDVLARRDVARAADARPLVDAPRPAALAAVLEENLERRRQAAWRWMDALTPEEAAHAHLPEEPRDALLLLRALRDGGDMRAAAWAMLGFNSPDPRVRGEAVDAMLALTRALRAERARFANDFDPNVYRPFVTPLVESARALRSVTALRSFAEAVLRLAHAPDPALKTEAEGAQ